MITLSIVLEGGNMDRGQAVRLLLEAVKSLSDFDLNAQQDYEATTFGDGHIVHTGVKVDDKEWTNATQLNCCG